jgi:hypothetical protein
LNETIEFLAEFGLLGLKFGVGFGDLESRFKVSELAERGNFVVEGVGCGGAVLGAVLEGLVEGLECFFVVSEFVESVAAIA